MNLTRSNDPEWVDEKMFGEEEFDSPIIYYVVDIADQFVLYYGFLENCKKFQQENHAGIVIVDYSQLTKQMIDSIPEPF